MLGKLLGKDKAVAAARETAREALLIEEMANCFGVESKGMGQIRGNCCLVLGPEALVWTMWRPHRTTSIPRTAFRSVEVARSHLGKSKGVDLVKLVFDAGGANDSVAWIVRDKDAWLAQLKAICESNAG